VVHLISGHEQAVDRARFIHILASFILVFALLQVALGMAQLFNLAPLLRGFVVFDAHAVDSNIMGNIGQRNQYAQFLCWGIISACYLHAVGKLRMPFFVLSVLFMAWLSACSGARLVWAYAFILGAVSVFWLVRRQTGVAVRMSQAGLIAVVLMICLQLASKQIAELLAVLGLTTHSVSGTERFFAAGFGFRRWIEWTKAIEIFTQHPWTGIGWGRFGAYSAELELSGGLPKSPESWLFIHCHNLFFQLLAETGLLGVLIIFIPTLICLLSYVRGGQQTAENMLLLCIGLVAMTHSMFEYPLWYLPFLTMFVIVLLMAPLGVSIYPCASILSVGLVACVLAIGYVVNGVVNFRTLVMYNMPAGNAQENAQRLQSLFDVEKDPLWATDADFVLVNYLVASRSDLKLKLQHFERLAQFRPYPEVLLRLSMLYGLDHQAEKQNMHSSWQLPIIRTFAEFQLPAVHDERA
jgi:O-antigen ligase